MSATARTRGIVAPIPASRLSDIELMRACGSPEVPDAWEEFVRRFNRFVCVAVVRAYSHSSRRRTGFLDPDAVADLVQDVYVRLLDRSMSAFGTFRGESDAAVYVYIGRVAISVAIDAQRRELARKRRRDVVSLDAVIGGENGEKFTIAGTLRSSDPSPEQNAIGAILRAEVSEVLGTLLHGRNAARDLRIAEAYILDGVPLTEVAESIGGIGSGALKSSVRRTGSKLRTEIARRERSAILRQARLS